MSAAPPRPSASRVLRDRVAARYAFAPLVADAPSADDPGAVDEARAAVEAARAEGYAAGADDGAAAARAEADVEIAALRAEADRLAGAVAAAEAAADEARARAAEAAARLEAAWDAGVRALEAPLAALAVAVAEGVLEAPLSDAQQEAAHAALAEAVDAVAGTAPTTIAMHPVDLLRLQEGGLADALGAAHPALRWESDAHLAPGDWTVETPEAAVHRLRAPMLTALRERLGLPDLP